MYILPLSIRTVQTNLHGQRGVILHLISQYSLQVKTFSPWTLLNSILSVCIMSFSLSVGKIWKILSLLEKQNKASHFCLTPNKSVGISKVPLKKKRQLDTRLRKKPFEKQIRSETSTFSLKKRPVQW